MGLDITQRSYPGALFFSANNYHHHVGVNTWGGINIPAPPSNAVGLQYFSVVIPNNKIWKNIIQNLKKAHIQKITQYADHNHRGIIVQDPSGNGLDLCVQIKNESECSPENRSKEEELFSYW